MTPLKGLDDLLATGRRPRIREVTYPPPELGERRIPYPTETKGPVETGTDLARARTVIQRAISKFVKSAHPGTAQVIATPAGTGKTTALANALHDHSRKARIVVGTKKLAAELANDHDYHLIEGRNQRNCERYEVVQALADRGFAVEKNACGTVGAPRCPARSTCAYFQQFAEPGTWVSSTEQLYNAHFLSGVDLVVLDDPDLQRAVLTFEHVTPDQLALASERVASDAQGALRILVTVLQHALVDIPEGGLTGPGVWDHLAKTAAKNGHRFDELVQSFPRRSRLPDPGAADHVLTVEDINRVPPASLGRVVAALREELDAFRTNEPFNSRLRLGVRGITVGMLRDHIRRRDGQAYIAGAAVLVLDATPVRPLVNHVLALHERLKEIASPVTMPPNIRVVQYADRANGHGTLRSEENRQAVLREVAAERERFPVEDPEDEAVICYKALRDAFIEMGFAESQVLTFGSVRGTNALAEVKRLHIVGRPLPPPHELEYVAQVVFHDEVPISNEVVLRPALYGGQALAVDVVDYADSRVSTLVYGAREDELTQVVHRARLLTMTSQASLDEAPDRKHVRLALHTNHPVPGLRVDEVVMSGEASPNTNDRRSSEAEARVLAARDTLVAEGKPASINAVARRARADKRTVGRALGKVVDTHRETNADRAGLPRTVGKVVDTLKDEHARALPGSDGARAHCGKVVDTLRKDLLEGVHHLPEPTGELIEPVGEPCRCSGCFSCESGFDLHFLARIPPRYQERGTCRWCELKGGKAG